MNKDLKKNSFHFGYLPNSGFDFGAARAQNAEPKHGPRAAPSSGSKLQNTISK
jgi:hypothetical protein